MAEILDIKKYFKIPRYTVCFYLKNSAIARNYSISLFGFVREQWRPLNLSCEGNVLILDGPIADSNGVIIPAQEAKVNEVADMLQNTMENDVPGFRSTMRKIIQFNQYIENLDFDMVMILDMGLKGETKKRFMQKCHYQVYAIIIRKAFEKGPFSSAEERDNRINDIFNNENLIASIIREVEAD